MREGEESIFRLRADRDAAILAAQAAVRDTTRLTRLLAILSDPAPLEQLLDRVLSTLSELFSADIAVLLDPAGSGTYSPLASIGLPEEITKEPFSNAQDGYTRAAMESRTPILLVGMDADSKVEPQLRELGALTGVWLPVIGNHSARGVLILARCKPVPFVHTEAGLLSAMTYRIGLSLEQAQRNIQLEQVVNSGREIRRDLNEAVVSAKAVSRFIDMIGADAAALYMKDTLGKFNCVADKCSVNERTCDLTPLTDYLVMEGGFSGARSYSAADLDELIEQLEIELPQNIRLGALLAVPLFFSGQVQGILFGIRLSVVSFSPETLQMAMLYASQISAVIENARLYRSAQDELAERKQVGLALKASDERFRALIRSVSDVISILTADGHFTYVSPAAEEAWECPTSTLLTQKWLDRIHPDYIEGMQKHWSLLLEQPNATSTHTLRLRQGENGWRDFEVTLTNLLDESAVGGIVATCHDVTERKTYEHELRNLAYNDALTGLPNRAYFKERLERALERANVENRSVAVIFLDLDNFKIVNDSLGHAWGDHLLTIIADRLRACLRKEDSAARLGGDEFTILIEEISTAEQVIPIVQRIITALKEPVRLKDQDVFSGSSIGIAISSPQDRVDDLLRKADLAMYEAKNQGKGGYAIFNPKPNAATTDEKAIRRIETETELRRAIERREFQVVYSPIVSLDSHAIYGAEALAQWLHPTRGLLRLNEFLPLAIETGIASELGRWFMEETFQHVQTWQTFSPIIVSFKLSTRLIRQPFFASEMKSGFMKRGLNLSRLILEVAENNLDPEPLLDQLITLRSLGLQIAIDGSDVGYSNLKSLQQFPADILKLNLSFLQGLTPDPWRAIVEGSIAIANSFGLKVIASGIETDEQAVWLRSKGCEFGQGDLFAPSLQAEAFRALLMNRQ